MLPDAPSLLSQPQLLVRLMGFFWLKALLRIAPRRLKDHPLLDWHISEKNKCAIESLAPVLGKEVSSALGWKGIETRVFSVTGQKRIDKLVDELIFLYCRLEPTVKDPFVRLRIEEAANQNNTEFFIRLGESLKEGPIQPLDLLKLLLIYGWHVRLAPEIPLLRHCTDNCIYEFAEGFLARATVSPDAVKKARQRLGLRRASGGEIYHHAKRSKRNPGKWEFS